MPLQAPDGTCRALNLRLPPPELRGQMCAVHASRLWYLVTAAPGLYTGRDGHHGLGKLVIPGPGGGPWAVPKPCPPNGHCPGLRPGRATSLPAGPPAPPAEVHRHFQGWAALGSPGRGFPICPLPGQQGPIIWRACRPPLAGESGLRCGKWSGRGGSLYGQGPWQETAGPAVGPWAKPGPVLTCWVTSSHSYHPAHLGFLSY